MRLDEAARYFIDTPFRHQGRSLAVGIDCIGLLVFAGIASGHPLADHDSTSYGRNPHDGLLESHLRAAIGPARSPDTLAPGDVAAIAFAGAVRHVGIVAEHPQGGLSLIHTNSAVGRVTEARLDAKWRKRIANVYRPEPAE